MKHILIGGNHSVAVAHIERASFAKGQTPAQNTLTLVTTKEGQKDFSGPEAEAAWLDYRAYMDAPADATLAELLAEVKELRAELAWYFHSITGAKPNAVQELPKTPAV